MSAGRTAHRRARGPGGGRDREAAELGHERELIALVGDLEMGRVTQDKAGELTFTYADEWRAGADAYPLSLSLPLVRHRHGDDAVRAFLLGLLPDSEATLDAWARRFRVSAANPFALLAHVGEDCAGAVQFVRPERVEVLRQAAADDVRWLTDTDLEMELHALTAGGAPQRGGTAGQFSLAGAQPKTALLHDPSDGRWGVPTGRIPTTHILKPPTGAFSGFAENEQFCLRLAAALEMPAVASHVATFGRATAIVVRRYDRLLNPDGSLTRLHQEDCCQALGVSPRCKYQNEGGPGIVDLVALLRDASAAPLEDVTRLLDAVIFNWLIVGTDAHAKNFALLIEPGGVVRLAPLYDLLSALPYPDLEPLHSAKLAMHVGGEYVAARVTPPRWRALADALGFHPDDVLGRASAYAAELPRAVEQAYVDTRGAGLTDPILDTLRDAIAIRAKRCGEVLGLAAAATTPAAT